MQLTHCGYCGTRFSTALWPQECTQCHNISYRNPIPVACIIIPVASSILLVRRAINPGKGEVALPGGFIEIGESWQMGAARELFEETNISIDPEKITPFKVLSTPTPHRNLLIFALGPRLSATDIPPFTATSETSELLFIDAPVETAFPLHTEVIAAYFHENRK